MDPKETSIFTAVVIFTLTVGVIIVYFVVSIIRQQRRNLQLSRKHILSEITALENERSRISNDLHDEISPTLSVIKFQINSLKVSREEDMLQAQQAAAHLDNLIEKLRQISYNLMPNALTRKGLWYSIEEFISHIQATTNIRISVQYNFPEAPPQLSHETNMNLYRLVQEVIHNGVKHARASDLQLLVSRRNQHLTILYKDNGVGFDYDKALQEGSGFGLRSMKSRVDILGGKMTTESRAHVGTAYLFEIPLKP